MARLSKALALVLLPTLSGLAFAASEPKAASVSMAEEAKAPAPNVPAPAAFAAAKGFTAAELGSFRDVMATQDLEWLARQSAVLFQHPAMESLRKLSRVLADRTAKDREWEKEFREEDVLFTYMIPNDPQLLLGMGKTRDGKVTSLPRLLSGALDARPKPVETPKALPESLPGGVPALEADGEEGAVFENFLLRNPEQVCTAGMSYALNADGSNFNGIELMPPPVSMEDPLMRMLLFIDSNPSPIFITEDDQKALSPSVEGAKAAEGEAVNEEGEGFMSGNPDDSGPVAVMAKRLKTAEVPLAELTALFSDKKAGSLNGYYDSFRDAFRILEETAAAQRLLCTERGNRFIEVKRRKGSELSLFSCERSDGRLVGMYATAAADYFPRLSTIVLGLADADQDIATEVDVDFEERLMHLSTLKGEKLHGPELVWEASGPALALDFKVPDQGDLGKSAGEYDVFEWHDNGRLKMIGHRKGGKPLGDERSYYANGALAGHVTFAPGAVLTSYREWYENRFPAEDTRFDAKGTMHGVRRWWHSSGRQAGELTYDGGDPHGTLTMWYENGRVGVRADYKNAKLEGDLRWAYEDGGSLYEGRFSDDKPDGLLRMSLANGVVITERTYKKGEPEGTWTSYDASGKPAQEFSFRKGQKEGKATMTYPDGQIAVEIVWRDGKLEGPLTSYFPGGQVAATCTYEGDRLTAFQRFHKTGEPAMDGKIVDQEKGLGQFSTFRAAGTPIVFCNLANFEPDGCRVFDEQGSELLLPTYAELVQKLQPAPVYDEAGKPTARKMAWQPEKCGGYQMKMNFDPIIDYGHDLITVDISTKAECTDPNVASSIYCSIGIEKGQVKVEPCSMAGDMEGDLAEIIAEMDGGEAPAEVLPEDGGEDGDAQPATRAKKPLVLPGHH